MVISQSPIMGDIKEISLNHNITDRWSFYLPLIDHIQKPLLFGKGGKEDDEEEDGDDEGDDGEDDNDNEDEQAGDR